MATFAKSLPIFFVLLLVAVDQTVARESRFFSKVTRTDPTPLDTTKTPDAQQIINVEAKEQQEPEDEQPSFLPQTSENGSPYGLYAVRPSAAEPQKEEATNFNNVETLETKEATTTAEPEPDNYQPSKNYAPELQGLGSGYTKPDYGNYFHSYNNKQGMSDTRFMDNGRYYNNDVVQTQRRPVYYNSREYRSRSFQRAPEYYNKDGFYSGSADAFGNYYNNNNNNARTGYQQQQEQEEFQFDP